MNKPPTMTEKYALHAVKNAIEAPKLGQQPRLDDVEEEQTETQYKVRQGEEVHGEIRDGTARQQER